MSRPRRFAQRVVYGFLGWFESFDSVWQTTILIFGGWGIEALLPGVDPGHLVFLLVLSLYATFTQNGLAHGNKLTSDKLDDALDRIEKHTQLLVRLARNEENVQATVIAQSEAIVDALAQLRATKSRRTPARKET